MVSVDMSDVDSDRIMVGRKSLFVDFRLDFHPIRICHELIVQSLEVR